MTDYVIKRGYVKWTDDNGVEHKEPLADHPELLAEASPKEQLAAEEARRLNAAAEVTVVENEDSEEENVVDTLEALKSAPEDILTADQLISELAVAEATPEEIVETKPTSAAEAPKVSEAPKPAEPTKYVAKPVEVVEKETQLS